jgi:hypothetical protein
VICKGVIFDFNRCFCGIPIFGHSPGQDIAGDLRGCETTEEELATHTRGLPNSYVLKYLAVRPVEGKEPFDLIQIEVAPVVKVIRSRASKSAFGVDATRGRYIAPVPSTSRADGYRRRVTFDQTRLVSQC